VYSLSRRYRSQLEAIIRISESLAKLTLSSTVKNHHVEEAIRLFKYSTMDAVVAGSADGLSRGELNEEMSRIERDIRRRLPLGWTTTYATLIKEFVTQQGHSNHALERTLYILEKREVIRFSGQKKVIHRCVVHAVQFGYRLTFLQNWCLIGMHLTYILLKLIYIVSMYTSVYQ